MDFFFLLLKTKGEPNLREMKLVKGKRDCILWLDVFSKSPVSLIILVKHPTKIGLYLGSGIYSIFHFFQNTHWPILLFPFLICIYPNVSCLILDAFNHSSCNTFLPSSKFHCLEIGTILHWLDGTWRGFRFSFSSIISLQFYYFQSSIELMKLTASPQDSMQFP